MSESSPSFRVPVGSSEDAKNPEASAPSTNRPQRPAITPLIDIHDGPDGLILEADLPGATRSNLVIQLEHNVLSLEVQIEPCPMDGGRILHREFSVGDYHRSFILSDDVDRERITAELNNGVLKLFLPRADRVRGRRIEIQS